MMYRPVENYDHLEWRECSDFPNYLFAACGLVKQLAVTLTDNRGNTLEMTEQILPPAHSEGDDITVAVMTIAKRGYIETVVAEISEVHFRIFTRKELYAA